MKTMVSKMEKNISSSGDEISNQVGIVCDLLSRLPVKSLMRFKCVSKHWLNIIEDDKYFIDLFHTRSKLRPCLFVVVRLPWELPEPLRLFKHHRLCEYIRSKEYQANLLTADLCGRGRTAASGDAPVIHNINKMISVKYEEILKPVNGMICFTSTSSEFGVRMYNLSTRELTPWLETTFIVKMLKEGHGGLYRPRYHLGFDPATNEHKVICLWKSKDNYSYSGVYESSYEACEVLTVGNNAWRIIEEIPQYDLADDYLSRMNGSIYVNGSVYWITKQLTYNHGSEQKIIVAFDVGSEKFRTIGVPKFITDQLLYDEDRYINLPVSLFEVKDRVGLLRKIRVGYTVKLWILEDNYKRDISNIGTTSCNQMWTEVNIELPFQWDQKTCIEFQGVPSSDEILIQTYEYELKSRFHSLFYFNWKNKTFRKVESIELCSSIAHLNSQNASKGSHVSFVSTFIESLLPVLKKSA